MKLSVCLIVKNEELVLARCLSCVAKFADEIIVVDTGSTDDSKAIANKYTNKVFDFKWQNDFSLARNYSFSKATGDYIMWIDSDDIVIEKEIKKILKLKNTPPFYDVYMFKYHISFDSDNKPNYTYYRERIVKNNKHYFWQGFIHETITPIGDIKYCNIAITHKKEKVNNPKRNLQIYQYHIKNGVKLDTRNLFYYARELFYNEQYKSCISTLKRFLQAENKFVPNEIDAYKTLSTCYLQLKQPQKALNTLFNSIKLYPPDSETCCLIGEIFLQQKQYNNCIFWYKCALNCNIPINTSSFIQSDFYGITPILQLSYVYYYLGDLKNAKKYYLMGKKLKPNHPVIKINAQYFE